MISSLTRHPKWVLRVRFWRWVQVSSGVLTAGTTDGLRAQGFGLGWILSSQAQQAAFSGQGSFGIVGP